MTYDELCDEIVAQTNEIASLLERRADPSDARVTVPSCPEWNVGQLLRHLGGVQRWAVEVVAARADGPVPDEYHGALTRYADEDLAVVVPWLTESATSLVAALREAGPSVALWTPVPGGTTDFYARRFAHETLVHRADATLALGEAFGADAAIVTDALDEWMELGSLPLHLELDPRVREVLAPGRTIRLHATDADGDRHADWLVDLTGDVITWRRSSEPAAVTVDAPLTSLLLLVYRRISPAADGVTVSGDEQLLDLWLARVAFG